MQRVPTLIMHGDDDQIVPINADLLASINEQKGLNLAPGKTKNNDEENDKSYHLLLHLLRRCSVGGTTFLMIAVMSSIVHG
ncbi:MAG: hypothetical protein WAZ77_06960 [Candidatus Nitrosopolaris sp.]|jgi:hypothetical protein